MKPLCHHLLSLQARNAQSNSNVWLSCFWLFTQAKAIGCGSGDGSRERMILAIYCHHADHLITAFHFSTSPTVPPICYSATEIGVAKNATSEPSTKQRSVFHAHGFVTIWKQRDVPPKEAFSLICFLLALGVGRSPIAQLQCATCVTSQSL